ncbi:uncharacterized protein Dana_GF24036 [Drosophila ananassae]|uniref:Uncharacterized protein n=1 Tax=Drosophila ananassae TaxID=7217 RepID=B3MAY1_DROAN|nr:uncharacterized protein LOC6506672 [Drosophila ananassae]EDV40247.1 uncharacterized protein Dana_GF24036 [Drosophila ananassae]
MASQEEEEIYTEDETNQAMSLLKENQLPMSELLTALKYVRILNDSLNPGHGIQDPPIVPVPEVAPPPFDWDEKEDQPMIRQL